mmetsp:Transcript_21672/g.42572  ORF Transcript_21672/g.42572 Transcript_21672/m.42572 type:complete len:160 (-) Transcript_21672:277-756(-)|eukprot:CAMPEP_0171484690 /NCGR_PEP_ID=MMETSP0958-20121227/140_1 /TAXON_ID=87120 /ORGANISM="Aurantiochytrium limacinum, Strain ATCCMYA-1381" /LENGTH=159 /DNA_ID=CAMNT_0012017417 /DNA_START=75 /DNA_END=554 /DNA_ORIENTATION=+
MTSEEEPLKYPLPPFTEETARQKVQAAEDAWNTKDPVKVSMAYSPDTEWRNRDKFVRGRDEVREFLKDKWENEVDYRLKKHLFAFVDNKIAVTFQYEYRSKEDGQWYRSYGNEHWTFDERGYMKTRNASINDVKISAEERVLATDEEHDLEAFSTGVKR